MVMEVMDNQASHTQGTVFISKFNTFRHIFILSLTGCLARTIPAVSQSSRCLKGNTVEPLHMSLENGENMTISLM